MMDRTQKWLASEVRKRTDMYIDETYLSKIISGKKHSKKLIEAINDTLWHTPWCPVVDD